MAAGRRHTEILIACSLLYTAIRELLLLLLQYTSAGGMKSPAAGVTTHDAADYIR